MQGIPSGKGRLQQNGCWDEGNGSEHLLQPSGRRQAAMIRSREDSPVLIHSAHTNQSMPGEGLPVVLRVAFWMILAAAGYASMFALVKHLSADVSIYVVIFWRYVLALLVFVPWAIRGGAAGLKTRRLGLHMIRAALMVIHGGTLMVAILMIPLAEATSLIFTIPLFATVLAVIVLRETVDSLHWMGLAIGFSGVLIIIRPGFESIHPAVGLVFISAITGAAIVILGKILLRNDSVELTVFLVMLFSVPLSLIPALFWWQWPTVSQIPSLILLALLANAYMYGLSRALKIADTSLVMIFDFLRMPFAALSGFLFFAEVLDPWCWVGASIIFGSSIYITRREMQLAQGSPAHEEPEPQK